MQKENILKKFQAKTNTYLKSAVGQGIILSVAVMISSSVLSWFLSEAWKDILPLLDQGICQSMFFSIFLALCSIAWVKLIKGWQWSKIGFNPVSKRAIAVSILSGGGIFLLLMALGIIYVKMLPLPAEPQPLTVMAAMAGSWQQVIPLYLISSLLAPVGEEIFFRGVLYRNMAQEMSVSKAVAVTSLVFAMMHFDLYRLPLLWIAGVWLNMLRIKYDSLYSAMLAHSVWNTLMISVAFLV